MSSNHGPGLVDLFLTAVGKRVRTHREAAGLTLEGVAASARMAAEQLEDFELGGLDIPLSKLRVIADGLGVTAADLLNVSGAELALGS